jgi:hypothetical protein
MPGSSWLSAVNEKSACGDRYQHGLHCSHPVIRRTLEVNALLQDLNSGKAIRLEELRTLISTHVRQWAATSTMRSWHLLHSHAMDLTTCCVQTRDTVSRTATRTLNQTSGQMAYLSPAPMCANPSAHPTHAEPSQLSHSGSCNIWYAICMCNPVKEQCRND